MALRSDMDVYARSCTKLDNWDLAPTGGISRRRGMRTVAEAMALSVLIPFVYSEDETYLLELGCDALVVRLGADPATVVRTFESDGGWRYDNLRSVTWQQINSLLLICAPGCALMSLRLDADGGWEFAPFEFKCPPWMTTDLRDTSVTLTPEDSEGLCSVQFDEGEPETERSYGTGDMLRVSYYTPKREAQESSADMRAGSWTLFEAGSAKLTTTHTFKVGAKIAVAGAIQHECYVCTADWTGGTDFTEGVTSPANYQENFLRAEDMTGFNEVAAISALESGMSFHKGDKVRVVSGYWRLYQCVRQWSGSTDMLPHKTDPANYPKHFIAGVPVGDALPCKGTWKFHCSGVWYGAYEVRRSYGSDELTSMWETVGESISPIAEAENNLITGDESNEECYLRLFLTSVRCRGTELEAGWPPDSCDNKLVVSAYKHDMILKVLADGFLMDDSGVQIPLEAPLTTDDWSWGAFNSRYGYPTLAALHESRLVLASTAMQPQTIWMSRTDDLNNFDTGDGDDAALLMTMNTTTQAAICWLFSHDDCLMLGTEDAEWVIRSGSGGALTAGNARLSRHGSIGSAHMPAFGALDRVLYCERGSGRLFQYGYSYEHNAYISTDMTVFADHIATGGGGIVGGAVIRKPYCVGVFVLGNGTLALMSYNTLHNVNAWHRYVTAGKIVSVAVLSDGMRRDKLFLITLREGRRMLEVIDADSAYADADNLDYVSTVETTAFAVPDANERKVPQSKLQVYLQQPVPAANVVARTGNTGYSQLNKVGMLPAGWTDIVTLSGWTDRPLVGLKIKGNVECSVLAMQA